MSTNVILARSTDGFIGRDGKLPWRLGTDLLLFQARTVGNAVVMGRKTYESIPNKRGLANPLPGRVTVVISNTLPPLNDPTSLFCVSPNLAGLLASDTTDKGELYYCGGLSIYEAALPRVNRLFLSDVDCRVGDSPTSVRAPVIDESAWTELFRRSYPASAKDQYPFTWRVLERPR